MNSEIAVISLTYNRPEYIEQSFRSLYDKTEEDFDHYVFDDNSRSDVKSLLRSLKREFGFELCLRGTHLGIAQSLMMARETIRQDYDYYLKLDSDIKILSDNFISNLVEVIKSPKVGVVTPRIEGIRNQIPFRNNDLEYFNGHAMLFLEASGAGCSMLIQDDIFRSYVEPSEPAMGNSQFGIDSRIQSHAVQLGYCIGIVEDLSVFQIDNEYGQRRKDAEYFHKRNRYISLDRRIPESMLLSEEIYPLHPDTNEMKTLWLQSRRYDGFKANVYRFLAGMRDLEETCVKSQDKPSNDMKKIQVYKIISPANYPADPNIEHGDSIYTREIPDWAKDNSRVEVEREEREILEESDLEDFEVADEEPDEWKCEECGFIAANKAGLKAHQRAKH